MFDFERLDVYQKAKIFNNKVVDFISGNKQIDRVTNDQLRRASFSILLNIAEGTGRYSKPDRCNFFVIARGSVFECVAVFEYLKDRRIIENETFNDFYNIAEELSKMLYSMILHLKSARV